MNKFIDISNADYHKHPALSRSQISNFIQAKTPAHYWYENLREGAEGFKGSKATEKGSALHTMYLEPQHFPSETIVAPPSMDPKKGVTEAQWSELIEAANKAYAAILAEGSPEWLAYSESFFDASKQHAFQPMAGKKKTQVMATFLKQRAELTRKHFFYFNEFAQIVEMSKALWDNQPKLSEQIRTKGLIEKSSFWTDKETGLELRLRFDCLLGNRLIDVKSTKDASPSKFYWSAIKDFRYDIQDAYYRMGLKAFGIEIPFMEFLCVENQPKKLPGVALYRIDEDQQKIADAELRQALRDYAECKSSNNWPGYSDELQSLSRDYDRAMTTPMDVEPLEQSLSKYVVTE